MILGRAHGELEAMRFHLVPALVVASGLSLWLGCADETPLLEMKAGCTLSSECKSPLVCAFQKCHVQCKSSKDCDGGKGRCVQSDKPYYVCQFPEDALCTQNSQCARKQLCAKDGKCHDQCSSGRDCLQDQVCTEGACADTPELVGGVLASKVGEDAGVGLGCIHSTDCPGDLVCKTNVCTVECAADKDCPVTWTCKPVRPGGLSRCHPPGAGGAP